MKAEIEIPDVDLDGPLAEVTDAAQQISRAADKMNRWTDVAAKDLYELLPQVKRLLRLLRLCAYAFIGLCVVSSLGIAVAVLL
jgi:hypothetical protein